MIAQRAALGFLAVMFALPFANPLHSMPLTSFYTEWLALVAGLAALVCAARPTADDRLPAISAWLAAAALLLLAQPFLVGIAYAELPAIGALYLAWAAALAWLGRRLARALGAQTVIAWLAAALVAGGLVNAAAAFVQFYRIDSILSAFAADLGSPKGAYGQLAQPNHLSDYLALALASVAWLRLRGRIGLAAAIACAAVLLYALAISGSRASLLYLAAGAILAWWLGRGRLCLAIVLAAAAYLALQLALAHTGLNHPTLPPGAAASGYSAMPLDRVWRIDSVRQTLWAQALLMWAQHPLLGVGWGQYPGAYFEAAAAFGGPPGYGHAHNIVAELAAETGIAGLAIAAAGYFAWWREARATDNDPRETWWTGMLLAVIGIHSLVEYAVWYANFLGVAAVAAGVACAGAHGAARIRLARWPSLAAAGIAALGIVLAAGLYSDYRLLEGTLAAAKRDPRSIPRHQAALLALRERSLLAPWADVIWAGLSAGGLDHLPERLALGARVQQFAPQPASAYWQAALLAAAGDEPAALAQIERAQAVFPEGLRRFVAMAEAADDPAVRRLGAVGRTRAPRPATVVNR